VAVTPAPRLIYRLHSSQALRQQMTYRRMTVRELSAACGRPSYKSTIGNLRAGTRNTCSAHLAARIEESLCVSPGLLFEPVMTNVRVDSRPTYRGARAA